ncbi:MAG: minor capsid protein [Plesiomonas shigelloides]
MKLKDYLKHYKRSNRPIKIKIGHTYPHRVETSYANDMRAIVRAITNEINNLVMPALKEELKVRDAKSERMDSNVPRIPLHDPLIRYDGMDVCTLTMPDPERMDGLADVLGIIRFLMKNLFPAASLASSFAQRTYNANEKKVEQAVAKSLGIAIALPGGDQSVIDSWVVDNTSMIDDLQSTYLLRIQRAVSDGYVKGQPYTEIAKGIQKETGIAWRRAKNIARDQIGTLNGLVTKHRDEELGVDEFIWRTMRDARVRGNPSGLYPKARPSHFAREGKSYSWKEGAGGEFPGTPILCRCYAEAVIEI